MKYRKKPVEVEARQLTLENMEEIAEWCGGKYFPPNDLDYHSTHTVIVPRPGHVNSIAHCGNWIVRFPDGAMKVMFDDDFSDEYEEIHGDLLLMRADQPVYLIDEMYDNLEEPGDHGRLYFRGVLMLLGEDGQ